MDAVNECLSDVADDGSDAPYVTCKSPVPARAADTSYLQYPPVPARGKWIPADEIRRTALRGDRRGRMYYCELCKDEFGDWTVGPKIWTGGVLYFSVVPDYKPQNTNLFVVKGELLTLKAPPLACLQEQWRKWYDVHEDYFDQDYDYQLSDLMDHEIEWYPTRCRRFLPNGAPRRSYRRAGKRRLKKK